MEQLFTLLQAVVMLITALANPGVPAEVKAQGELIANQAIAVVNTELVRLQSQPSILATSTINTNPTGSEPVTDTTMTEPAPAAPASQARIEIISTNPRAGLGRQYFASDEPLSPSNFIEIGAVVYNDNGEVIKDAEVTITATDGEQNKVRNGTSSFYQNKFVYKYRYDFKTKGQHVITFTANGLSESVTLEVN